MDITNVVNEFYYHMALYELQVMNGDDYFRGLSYNSLLYINVIEQMEECTVSRIAETLHVTKSAVTMKINELAKQGLVIRRQSSQDKRVYHLELSPDMARVMGIYDEVFMKIEKELKKEYTEEELGQFCRIMQSISSYEWRKMKDE